MSAVYKIDGGAKLSNVEVTRFWQAGSFAWTIRQSGHEVTLDQLMIVKLAATIDPIVFDALMSRERKAG